jgi:protease I
LIEAGAAKGRRMTSWPSLRTNPINAGAHWADEAMVPDGNLITSRKPDDIPAFNRALIELFGQTSQPRQAA